MANDDQGNDIMKAHYTEADLLETYYMQPGESMPVMMHLSSCAECSARYERLDRKLREAAACHPQPSESFWALQRSSIMHAIASRARSRSRFLARYATAALLVLAIGGTAAYQVLQNVPPPPAQQAEAEEQIPADPWQSEELQEFGAVVEWESWVEETQL